MEKVSKIIFWIFLCLNIFLLISCVLDLHREYNMPYYGSTRTIVVMIINYAVVVVAVIVGVWAFAKESIFLLKVYAIIMLIALVYDVLYHTVLPNFEEDLLKAKAHIKDKWRDEEDKPCSMTQIQSMYSCCGTNTFEDYFKIHRKLPHSCYSSKGVAYTRGCLLAIETQFSSPMSVMVSSIVLMILIFAVACYLIMRLSINNNQ